MDKEVEWFFAEIFCIPLLNSMKEKKQSNKCQCLFFFFLLLYLAVRILSSSGPDTTSICYLKLESELFPNFFFDKMLSLCQNVWESVL